MDMFLDDPSFSPIANGAGSQMIEAKAFIPKELNQELKRMARDQGKHAKDYAGELLAIAIQEQLKSAKAEAAAKLREVLGDDWRSLAQMALEP